MAQPVWITPAGSLGVIPEGVFYQNDLLASTEPLDISITCTATSAATNLITCTSTVGIYPGLNVQFTGEGFGGIDPNIRYFVLAVPNSTQFSLTATESSTSPITLTTATGTLGAVFTQHVFYSLIAGAVPTGIQVSDNGVITGVPQAVASIQGVPTEVASDVTSKFAIRAYTKTSAGAVDRISDRTFTLTITGNDVPEFVTPAGSIGTFYDSDRVNFQFEITGVDPGDTNIVRVVGGALPGGLTITPAGLLTGYIEPTPNVDEPPGYDVTPSEVEPYDFLVSGISKNFEFTLEVSDGKSSNLRTFYMYVYDRATLTADDTAYTADTTSLTADETPYRRPFILNSDPSDLGRVRGDNYYAYQFRADDYDTTDLQYAIAVNQGSGFTPGLTLDPTSGWYYGYIPDQGITETEYSFNIYARQGETVGTAITCTATAAGTNIITCNSTEQLGPGTAIIFSGTTFGNVSNSATTMYFVQTVESATEFTITTNLIPNPDYPGELPAYIPSTATFALLDGSGSMTASLVVNSDPYPFSLTVIGEIDSEVTWVTPSDLGTIENGATSLLQIEAVNRGGRELSYRLKSGAFNELPQGLELLPTGEIVGRVTFNTFAIDLGTTTFDLNNTPAVDDYTETTWDSSFTFTVNAYAEDTGNFTYDVESITVTNGGSGYSAINTPVIKFSSPVGASATPAVAGAVTVTAGAITAVAVADPGAGYTEPATITITAGFGGSNAVLTPVMRQTGVVDVVSVFKTFTIRLIREYNAPYQNLIVQAMPPQNDRDLIDSLLNNTNIFVPEYIYRPDDPNFGKATRVNYQHAFGLAPESLDAYFESLYLNHYWKNLVLGSIETAQARDENDNVIYEVVYCRVVDDLVNAQGQSVSKIVNLSYPIIDPADGSTVLTQVYPNSLVNMRDQVIDVVGQISTKLPLWMTSKQADGRVLGFTPAWVMCYTNPGYSRQIAYYISTQFGTQLNRVDFKVDRYILDRSLSRNWDTETQDWTPQPTLTTFDRYDTPNLQDLGEVDIATRLAFADVNARTVDYIQGLGGLDGIIFPIDGKTLIFAKQENYPAYSSTTEAWQDYAVTYGQGGFDQTGTSYDESELVPGGTFVECSATSASTDRITCTDTSGMTIGDTVWFNGDDLSNLVSGTVDASGAIVRAFTILYINDSTHFQVEDPANPGQVFALSTATGAMSAAFANYRMGIWTINVDPITEVVTLELTEQTGENQYVIVRQGNQYAGVQLYVPGAPPPGQTRITWTLVPESSSTETVFDFGSVQWVDPVDMYDPTDQYDKYLVFPKANILV
jgi:hypothetical protein